MKFTPTRPTHYCAVCGDPLWRSRWPYAACKPCGALPCAHGHKPSDCHACAVDGDRAFDAAREGR